MCTDYRKHIPRFYLQKNIHYKTFKRKIHYGQFPIIQNNFLRNSNSFKLHPRQQLLSITQRQTGDTETHTDTPRSPSGMLPRGLAESSGLREGRRRPTRRQKAAGAPSLDSTYLTGSRQRLNQLQQLAIRPNIPGRSSCHRPSEPAAGTGPQLAQADPVAPTSRTRLSGGQARRKSWRQGRRPV